MKHPKVFAAIARNRRPLPLKRADILTGLEIRLFFTRTTMVMGLHEEIPKGVLLI